MLAGILADRELERRLRRCERCARGTPVEAAKERRRSTTTASGTASGERAMTGWIRGRHALLVVAALAGSAVVCPDAAAQSPVNVVERSYNPFRTGANTAESRLTPANVASGANQFHKRFVMSVDGKIEGSPLYASGVAIAGGTHDVVYVATMHNTVYAFDADTGVQLSARWLGNPVVGDDLHALKPTTIHAEWGIASTPVIDLAAKTLYVVRWGYEEGVRGPTFRLFGLDISDLGRDRFPSVPIDGYQVGGTRFLRDRQMQRAGLALAAKPDGAKAVVVAFGGGEGQGSPAGWVVAFDTAKLALGGAPANVWCSNPGNNAGPGGGGGVWMANAAPAIDERGDIYVVTGNGPYNPQFAADQLGESVVRLTWTPGNPGSLFVSDWFTPFLDQDRDAAHKDQDLAAGGVVALPDGTGVVVGGKDGIYYHVDRSAMGQRDFAKLIDRPFVASFDYQPWNGHGSLFDDLNQITSTDPFTIGHVDRGRTPHIHGTGVYFDNLLFVHGENNVVHVFARSNGHFDAAPRARGSATASWGTSSPGGMPGGILSLSANGTSNAILWANEAFGNLPGDPAANINPTPNILRAYDVSTVGTGSLQSIWDSEAEPNDRVGAATKFAPPLVANGKVFQATYDNQIVVYGLGAPSPTPTRDVRRTVVFIHADSHPGQDLFVRGGGKGGTPIRIRHRNWLNPHTNLYRWGDAYLDWSAGEVGQARPSPDLGGGSPLDWTTSLAQGQNQPYVWTAGYGIADENNFGANYWMLDVDMDCEQAAADGQGRRWFELRAFMVTRLMTAVAPSPGWEGDVAQTGDPAPPYASKNHMGICGMVNVFVANFPNRPDGPGPDTARFLAPSYTYLSPMDERAPSAEMLDDTPCVSPDVEKRCLGNLAQTCRNVGGRKLFRSVQDCNAVSAGGNFVQMCRRSSGECCVPSRGDICQ
jgi:outer membrane protein assembly factor BamB